jgi:predicted acylesterase/phospholipase RssA
MAVRRRRFAPLNYKGGTVWWYRFRPTHMLESWAWRKSDTSPTFRRIALSILVGRQLRLFFGRSHEQVAFERLRPGQRLTVVPVSQRTRAERKAAKRWTPGA